MTLCADSLCTNDKAAGRSLCFACYGRERRAKTGLPGAEVQRTLADLGMDDVGDVRAVWVKTSGEKVSGISVLLSPPRGDEDAPAARYAAIQPAAPVHVTVTPLRPRVSHPETRLLFLTDTQTGYRRTGAGELEPFHDEAALAACLALAANLQPDIIVHGGDDLDFPVLSRFAAEAGFLDTLRPALNRRHQHLAELRALVPHHVGYQLEGNHECFGATTRAVTERGFVPFGELAPEDRVLSVDDDGGVEWLTPSAYHEYDYQGDLLDILGVPVTPNHRVVGRSKNNGRWVERLASEVRPTAPMRCYRAATNNNPDTDMSDDDIRRAAWCWTDSHRNPAGKWTFYQRTPKSGPMLALFSGRTIYRQRGHVTFPNGLICEHPAEACEVHVGRSAHLDALVPDRDRLSPWVWKLSPRQVGVLLDEWVYTDGHKNAQGSEMLYVSRDGLRDDLRLLLATSGIGSSAKEYRPGTWRLNITRRATRETAAATPVPYSGKVWCLTVPNGRFFVEHEGHVLLSGNCRLPRTLAKQVPELADLRPAGGDGQDWPLLSVPRLLRLDEVGVFYVSGYPAAELVITPKLRCIHGAQVKSDGSTAALVVRSSLTNTLYGHTHRMEYCSVRDTAGQSRWAASPGTLARVDGAVPSFHGATDGRTGESVRRCESWTQGAALISWTGDEDPSIELITIERGCAVYRGQSYGAAA